MAQNIGPSQRFKEQITQEVIDNFSKRHFYHSQFYDKIHPDELANESELDDDDEWKTEKERNRIENFNFYYKDKEFFLLWNAYIHDVEKKTLASHDKLTPEITINIHQ